MPRLQILQHKSYHPYLEKNKQRVREDEAKAAEIELAKEQKRVERDSEARLTELRRRAGSPSLQVEEEDDNLPSTSASKDTNVDVGSSLLEKHRKKKAREEKKERRLRERLDFDFPSETARREARLQAKEKGKGKEIEVDHGRDEDERFSGLVRGDEEEKYHDKSWDDGGHINFFQDIEQSEKPRAPTLAEISKKKAEQEADKFTMYLKRPEREVKPWYTDRELKRVEDKATDEQAEERRARDRRKDIRAKERNDPMTQVNALLKPTTQPVRRNIHPPPNSAATPQDARLQREQSERQRALALIAKTKAHASGPKTWQDTPSTVAGGSWAEDLERRKERASNRFWDEERERDRVRGWERGVRGGRSWEA